MTATSSTTELEALNTILACVGDAPITQADLDAGSDAQLQAAQSCLNEASRQVQGQGWRFNTIDEKTYTPDEEGHIDLAESIVYVEATSTSTYDYTLTLRNSRLYDISEDTDVFTEDVTLRSVQLLPWTSLPDTARQYITIMAARKFASRSTASKALVQFTEQDEHVAHALLAREQTDAANISLYHTAVVAGIDRHRRRL